MSLYTFIIQLKQKLAKKWNRQQHKLKKKLGKKSLSVVSEQLSQLFQQHNFDIPVLLVSYNNAIYVENMVKQLNAYKIQPIIIDNCSTSQENINKLKQLHNEHKAHVIFSNFNHGHMVGFLEPIYSKLPNIFAYSDPDLQFNANLPQNFLKIMADLTQQYHIYKVGCALPTEIDGYKVENPVTVGEQTQPFYWKNHRISLHDWESRYWHLPIKHPTLELYAAKTDTTFAVYNKNNYIGDFYDGIRIADIFSVTHLPWFPHLDIMTAQDKQIYLQNNKSTTWKY